MNRQSATEQGFIQKLTEITEANLKNDHFGVSGLAREMGMSRSSLYLKVNAVTKKSVSRFISEVRLKKAMEMLQQTSLTVSEIAYEVGFGSPTYFIKCFHDFYGFPPGKVENNGISENDFVGASPLEPVITHKKKRRIFTGTIAAIMVFILLAVSIIVMQQFSSPTQIKDKSIAVLPLKNLNNDLETQILADGIMEDILNRLSQIRELNVKSRNSTEKYRKSTLPAPKIAAELEVSYLLEGSLLKDGERLRVYIQLIDAKHDKHIWSDHYDKDLSGIFPFISAVSRQVSNELETVLSSQEKEQIEKMQTQNTEAYNLYLKGRFFWHRRTKEDLKKSIDYFNQALAIDPNYALAYAGLADAYLILVGWRWYPEENGIQQSKRYALKALSIDNHLAEAHAVLGALAKDYDKNWDEAERELRLAVELNPNYSSARQYYAEYLRLSEKTEEALEQINRAVELNPNSFMHYYEQCKCYYNLGKLEEALASAKNALDINTNHLGLHWLVFRIYYWMGDDINAVDELKRIIGISDTTKEYENMLNTIYNESGIEGTIHWAINWQLNQTLIELNGSLVPDYGLIAKLYAMTNSLDSAIFYLEKKYIESTSLFRPTWIKNSYDFKKYHHDPRFIALIKKMGLEDL